MCVYISSPLVKGLTTSTEPFLQDGSVVKRSVHGRDVNAKCQAGSNAS